MTAGVYTAGGLPTAGGLKEDDANASFDPYAAVFDKPDLDQIYLAEVDTFQEQPESGATITLGTAGGLPTAGGLGEGNSGIIDTTTLFLGSETYIALPTDTNANQGYAATMIQPGRLRRSVLGARLLVDDIGTVEGEQTYIAFATDAEPLKTTDVDGREIRIKVLERGSAHPSLDDAIDVFHGVVRERRYDRQEIRLRVASRTELLETPIQSGRYAGTGGVEGGADLGGKPYPCVFGKVFGVTPDYLGVISGNHSYRVAGGTCLPINDVPAFFDQGVSLTKVGSSPSAGEYSVDTSTGVITIGGTVPTTPTCDVEGYVRDSTLQSTPKQVILSILEDFAQVQNTRIDYNSFDVLDSDLSEDIGVFVPSEETTSASVLREVLTQLQIWGGFNRQDDFEVGLLKAPGGIIRARFDNTNLIDIRRLEGPDIVNPPPWRIQLGYKRNYTVTSDVASGATESQRAFMAKTYRQETDSDGDIQTRHARSTTVFMPTPLVTSSAAASEVTRRLSLYDGGEVWRLVTGNVAPKLDVGQTVEIDMPDEGLDTVLATILSIRLDFARRETQLEVFW